MTHVVGGCVVSEERGAAGRGLHRCYRGRGAASSVLAVCLDECGET